VVDTRSVPPMPPTLQDLEESIEGLQPGTAHLIAGLAESSGESFRKLLAQCKSLTGSRRWKWPLLEQWNPWCLENDGTFYVWEPDPKGWGLARQHGVLVQTKTFPFSFHGA